MPSNRTPTEVIASVEQWASHALTQPNDPMRLDVAAVLAMARCDVACEACTDMNAGHRAHFDLMDAEKARNAALSAAGVGGGE